MSRQKATKEMEKHSLPHVPAVLSRDTTDAAVAVARTALLLSGQDPRAALAWLGQQADSLAVKLATRAIARKAGLS